MSNQDIENRVNALVDSVNILQSMGNHGGAQVGFRDLQALEEQIHELKGLIGNAGGKAQQAAEAAAKREVQSQAGAWKKSFEESLEPLVNLAVATEKDLEKTKQDLTREIETKTHTAVDAAQTLRGLMQAQSIVAADTVRNFLAKQI